MDDANDECNGGMIMVTAVVGVVRMGVPRSVMKMVRMRMSPLSHDR